MTDLLERFVDTAKFTDLFVQLGWDRPHNDGRAVRIDAEGDTYTLSEVATFKGIAIWSCPQLPPGRVQRDIDRQMRHESAERVLIFHDGQHQQWRWPQTRDAEGTGTRRLINHEHIVGRDNPALAQRLALIEIGLDEDVTVLDVTRRLRKAFDADRITKRFYKEFAKQHHILCDLIDGIQVSDDETQPELRWYASLLLNRLMFIYFMQRKGFLDNDLDYLRSRLEKIRALDQPSGFYEFYRDFLIPLFHDGLGTQAGAANVDDETIRELIGDIPYVNGGIFAPHPLEIANDIRIPDHAFEDIFNFFDAWQWHLDDRPTGNPNEVNPDMLGYIFEQFVNNREEVATGSKAAQTNADKGAYYTKEDVTGYMTANTLLPVFLERLEKRTNVNPWRLLQNDPDRYIWPSILHGLGQPLPDDIAVEQDSWPRPTWENTKPDSDVALPAESWWEVADRRAYANDLRARLRDGGIAHVNDAITYNLDLETLIVDCIDGLDNPDDVADAWDILSELRIIDPTCGSGAFLFAALGILHDLYTATFDAAERHARTRRTGRLDTLLSGVDSHANRDYYLLKHATLNNIYGVDIMPEAVEIARLRLFLKLIAQVEKRDDIEPLPDLEFNIRSGNALVGALDEQSIRERVSILNHDRVDELVVQAAEASASYRTFASAQEEGSEGEIRQAKVRHEQVSRELRDVLHNWWHEYDGAKQAIEKYLSVHRPFHWFIEFPDVFEGGGFDVVLGNPPYVAPSKVDYTYAGFATDKCPDIYAPCIERAASLLSADGRFSMIVPISLGFSSRFAAARQALIKEMPALWVSTYGLWPSCLFVGVGVRNTIVVGARSTSNSSVRVTGFRRFHNSFRPFLFETTAYTELPPVADDGAWPRLANQGVAKLYRALTDTGSQLGDATASRGKFELLRKSTAADFLSISLDMPPAWELDGRRADQTTVHSLEFQQEVDRDIAYLLLAGRMGLWWWVAHGDDFNVTATVLKSFPISPQDLKSHATQLQKLAERLREAQRASPFVTKKSGKLYGNFNLADSRCRSITDESDRLVLQILELDHLLPALRLADATFQKATSESGSTKRVWPFNWEHGSAG